MAKLAALIYDGCRLTELSEYIGTFNNSQHEFSIIDISREPNGTVTTEDGFHLHIEQTLDNSNGEIFDCIAVTGGDVRSVIESAAIDAFIEVHHSRGKVIGGICKTLGKN